MFFPLPFFWRFVHPDKKGCRSSPFTFWMKTCSLVRPGRDRRTRNAVRSAIAASWRRSERETQRAQAGIVAPVIGPGTLGSINADETMAVTPVVATRAAMVGRDRARRHGGCKNKIVHT